METACSPISSLSTYISRPSAHAQRSPLAEALTPSAPPSGFILLPFFIPETLPSFVMYSNARHLYGQLFFVSTLYGSFFFSLLGFKKGGMGEEGESNSPALFSALDLLSSVNFRLFKSPSRFRAQLSDRLLNPQPLTQTLALNLPPALLLEGGCFSRSRFFHSNRCSIFHTESLFLRNTKRNVHILGRRLQFP